MPLEIEYIDSDVIEKEGHGYVYLNLAHPLVAWEVAIGCLYSAEIESYLDNIKRPSFFIANAISRNDNQKIINEVIIESVRRERYPQKKSRIEGIYFFRDLDSAKEGLSWGGHFKLENLSDVYYHTKYDVTRCDANWITYAEYDDNGIIKTSYYEDLVKYWGGIPCPKFRFPVWEYIIDGVLNILGTKIKEKAYELSIKEFPASQPLLHLAMAAPHYNLNTGHIIPFITKVSDDEYELNYLIKINKNDVATIISGKNEKVKELDLSILQDPLRTPTPNLIPYTKRFRISENTIREWNIRTGFLHF